MNDDHCAAFLQYCLPRLRMRWRGFRRVQKQVCSRISRRMKLLGVTSLADYRRLLEDHPAEWEALDALCRIPISRFYRDRGIFDTLRDEIFPLLAHDLASRGGEDVRCWSAGCASGEEAYSLRILWDLVLPAAQKNGLSFRLLATDADPGLIARGREGVYRSSSLRDLPPELRRRAFDPADSGYRIKERFIDKIDFAVHDIRRPMPDDCFHLILCRNLVFTYFEDALQQEILEAFLSRLHAGGFLITGIHETLPKGHSGVVPHPGPKGIYRKLFIPPDHGDGRP